MNLCIEVSFTHSEILCYFWMIFSLIQNPGLVNMVYPMLLFGYVMVEEQTPGRFFWVSVIAYTQLVIVITFGLNVNFWD